MEIFTGGKLRLHEVVTCSTSCTGRVEAGLGPRFLHCESCFPSSASSYFHKGEGVGTGGIRKMKEVKRKRKWENLKKYEQEESEGIHDGG